MHHDPERIYGTTILAVRRDGRVAVGGDGQVTLGQSVMKGNARKVRRLYGGKVLAGFAGGTADAFTLFERFEAKLEKFGNLTRAAIELAKDWRSDRSLRRLEALLCVADATSTYVISGNGRCDRAGARSDRHRLGRRLRAGGRAGPDAVPPSSRRAKSSSARSISPRTSASTPIAISPSRSFDAVSQMTPREIVEELDKHIVGQKAAKRAVAIALRNRWRRGSGGGEPARRDHPEEHPDDRPDRRRARPRSHAGWRASPRRRSSRWRPQNSPKSVMSAAKWTRSSAILSRSP